MASDTVPGPVPLEPLDTPIQGTGDDAVHEHSAAVDTLTETLDGAALTETLLLDSVVPQEMPAWETLNTRPPIVSEPTREDDEVFGATEY